MCGIAGWFTNAPPSSMADYELHSMVNAISHRGPDGQGFFVSEHAALGHARLSIIDLQGGKQPMQTRDGKLCISFNGEIYNYKALKKELSNCGFAFATDSDTEVILNLYKKESWQGFARMRGMYAFALWDNEQSKGYLVRDTLGIKPLFYKSGQNNFICFGSEAKAIIARESQSPNLNLEALHLLLNFRYLPAHHTLFAGIEQLQPGQVLEWNTALGIRTHKLQSQIQCSSSMKETLFDSVQCHLTADVEVGAYLSGGIDSALITAIASRVTSYPLKTFTVDAGDDPNEAKNARRSAELLGVGNIQHKLEFNVEELLPRLIWHLETPKVNALQISLLAQLASKQVKVVLSGLGGDEIFFGYNVHKIMYQLYIASRLRPKFVSKFFGPISRQLLTIGSKTIWSEVQRSAALFEHHDDWARLYGIIRNVWDSPARRSTIYGERLLEANLPDTFDTLTELWPKHDDPVTAMNLFEWNNKMVNDLLWQEDRVSMAEGLEVRVPFVDSAVAHCAQSLGRKTLMPAGHLKGYMRQLARDSLPAEIVHRPKSGFQVDSADFFHRHLKPMAEELLSENKIKQYGLFNPDFVKILRNYSVKKAHRWHYFMLYLMLMSHLWIDVFEQQKCRPHK